jgi:hypothetical protein
MSTGQRIPEGSTEYVGVLVTDNPEVPWVPSADTFRVV